MKKIVVLNGLAYQNLKDENQLLQNEVAIASDFVKQIKAGNLTAEYPDSLKKRALATSLIALRDQMTSLYLEEKQRNWTNGGLAKFSETFRLQQQDEMSSFFDKIICNLVRYLEANQGGIFVLQDQDETDKHLTLKSTYAYQKKKFIQKRIELGQGLVGQCFLEQEPILMTEVPENYVTITSGLGEALPRNILLCPLMLDKEVLGVIELASFTKFESYQIEFVRKISENIASVYANTRIADRTKELLRESRLQAEQLKAQEEEMRQNMEELTASQEEMRRIQLESEAQTTIINTVAIVSKTDVRGNITYVNDEFLKWSKYSREEVMGKNHRILKSGHQPDEIFVDLWRTISSGRIWRGEVKNRAKDGSYYWVDAIIAPVLDVNGKPIEYIAQRFVINEKKAKEEEINLLLSESQAKEEELRQNMEELQTQQEELQRIQREIESQTNIVNTVAIVSKTDVRGNIIYVNDEFIKWSKYTREEIIGKNHRILKSGHQPDEIFVDLWRTISSGKIWRGEVKNQAKDGSYYWVDAIIAPVLDVHGKPKEYIAQRFVINDKKEREEAINKLLTESKMKEENLLQKSAELLAAQAEMQHQLIETEKLKVELEIRNQVFGLTTILSESDEQGVITMVNNKLTQVSQYSEEELIGQPHSIFRHPDMPKELFRIMWEELKKGEVFKGIIKNKAKDGSHYWVDAVIVPVRDDLNKIVKYVGARYHITDDELALWQYNRQANTLKLPKLLSSMIEK